jgi:hypothetical protein
MKLKSVRLAIAAVLAAVSLLGATQAGAVPGAVSAGDHPWCC